MTKRIAFGDGYVLFVALVTLGYAFWFSGHFIWLMFAPDETTNRAQELFYAFGAWYLFLVQVELLGRRRDADMEDNW